MLFVNENIREEMRRIVDNIDTVNSTPPSSLRFEPYSLTQEPLTQEEDFKQKIKKLKKDLKAAKRRNDYQETDCD